MDTGDCEAPEHARPGPTPIARDLLYRSLFEHALLEVHIWEVLRDEHGKIVTWRLVDANAAALKSWGLQLEDIVGQTADEVFPGGDATATFMPIVEQILATGEPKEWEVPFSGTDQVLHMVSFPVGEYFVSTGFDVSSDRRKERKLAEALRSLNQATQAGGVGLWDWDLRTNEVRYSDEWKRQLGHAPHEVSDDFEEWRSRVHPDDLERTMEQAGVNIRGAGEPSDAVFRMRHRDGSYRWILAQSSVVLDDDGLPARLLGSHIDITDRRRLEQRVQESQKLEAIGTLAAGIAHDFNNLLGAITGNLSLLREISPSDPEAPELLKEVEDAAQRAQALTYQLLTFSKGGVPLRNVASVRDLIMDSARFVVRGSRSRCVFSLADDLATVEVDLGQVNQVIDNLVINAMQAMPSGGTIQIDGVNVALDDRNPLGLPAGRYVQISVQDQGMGISSQDLPRIFDPFYTTKATGSGLGLSSSFSIVAAHGGRITVESEVGHGTTFRVFLPASDAAASVRAEAKVVGGAGRVLVMDDDASLRSLCRRMLQRLGYTCEVSSDGDEAVLRYQQALGSDHPFDAVILDLTIPGRPGGAQTMARLIELDPRVVGIVVSGYGDDDVLARFEAHGFRGRLRKPFDLAALSGELRRVLG